MKLGCSLLSALVAGLALGTTACSSDSDSDDSSDCAVQVTYSDKDGNAIREDETICKDVPKGCDPSDLCSGCDALDAYCDDGYTQDFCGSVSIGSSTQTGLNCHAQQ